MTPPPDNALSRHRFITLAGMSALAGCSGGGGAAPATSTRSISTGVTPTNAPTSPPTPASVSIARSQTMGAVPTMLAGLSYEKTKLAENTFTGSNSTLIGCFKLLGTNVVRIGGHTVDSTTWNPNGPGSTLGEAAPSDVNALAAFLRSTGWRAIYGINLATNTPALAAQEAAFVAEALGGHLYGFEIGNECDLYATNGLRASTYDLADFVAEWTSFANAIGKSASGAMLTGPASSANILKWTSPFAAGIGSKLGLLTQHYYRGNGDLASATLGQLLAPDPLLPSDLQSLLAAASANGISSGYRITECNSYYNDGTANVSDAFGSALWAIDFMMIASSRGAMGANFHGGGNLAAYTPIVDDDTAVTALRPLYYGMLFAAQIAPGPMYAVSVSTSLLYTAYAVAGNDGATYVVLVNKDPGAAAQTTINLGATATSATALVLAASGLTSMSGMTLGGTAIGNDGSWAPSLQTLTPNGSTLEVAVPAASAVLVKVS